MSVKITGGDSISRKLGDMANRSTSLPLDTIGAYATQEIIDRTIKGMDMDRRGFVPYKRPELREKRKAQTGHVDLYLSGNMLSAITHKITGSVVTILFRGEKENAKAHGHHNGSRWLPQRKFFGLDSNIKANIIERLQKWIANGYR